MLGCSSARSGSPGKSAGRYALAAGWSAIAAGRDPARPVTAAVAAAARPDLRQHPRRPCAACSWSPDPASARWRWTCSRCCSAARCRCCRLHRDVLCTPARLALGIPRRAGAGSAVAVALSRHPLELPMQGDHAVPPARFGAFRMVAFGLSTTCGCRSAAIAVRRLRRHFGGAALDHPSCSLVHPDHMRPGVLRSTAVHQLVERTLARSTCRRDGAPARSGAMAECSAAASWAWSASPRGRSHRSCAPRFGSAGATVTRRFALANSTGRKPRRGVFEPATTELSRLLLLRNAQRSLRVDRALGGETGFRGDPVPISSPVSTFSRIRRLDASACCRSCRSACGSGRGCGSSSVFGFTAGAFGFSPTSRTSSFEVLDLL